MCYTLVFDCVVTTWVTWRKAVCFLLVARCHRWCWPSLLQWQVSKAPKSHGSETSPAHVSKLGKVASLGGNCTLKSYKQMMQKCVGTSRLVTLLKERSYSCLTYKHIRWWRHSFLFVTIFHMRRQEFLLQSTDVVVAFSGVFWGLYSLRGRFKFINNRWQHLPGFSGSCPHMLSSLNP